MIARQGTHNPPAERSANLFARAASFDVTPKDRPVRLAGYASRRAPVSKVLDPIEVSVVLLEDSTQRCLIFSFDLMIVGAELQDVILARLERLGFRPDEVVLLASHTHYAPGTDRACAPLGPPDVEFVGHLAAAAEELVRQLQRARPSEIRMDLHQGHLKHSINRRRHWPFPTFGRTYGFRLTSISLAPNPSGPKDERATVLLLRNAEDGRVFAVIWHYTCHATAVVPENVISADYPGAVRRALREHFGDIPCVFVQGFCGDVRPDIAIAAPRTDLRQRLRRAIRAIASGPTFASPSAEDWTRWSRSMAARVVAIAQRGPVRSFSPASLQTGSAAISLQDFFAGSTPDKMLAARIVRMGEELEIVALSAEANVEWQRILDEADPVPAGRIRLYAGYLGALFGYLPTAEQVPEGGYEVEGFQPLFGLSGHFEPGRIGPAVAGCVTAAFTDLERGARSAPPLAVPAQR
jgi:hypothetical protein